MTGRWLILSDEAGVGAHIPAQVYAPKGGLDGLYIVPSDGNVHRPERP